MKSFTDNTGRTRPLAITGNGAVYRCELQGSSLNFGG